MIPSLTPAQSSRLSEIKRDFESLATKSRYNLLTDQQDMIVSRIQLILDEDEGKLGSGLIGIYNKQGMVKTKETLLDDNWDLILIQNSNDYTFKK